MKICMKAEHLTKKFGDRTVVDNLPFQVNSREVFGLLGPNGAGKSTTIETILGLKRADGGKVELLGMEPGRRRKELFHKVGVQLQSSNFQNNIRVEEICEELSVLYHNPADYCDLLRRFKLWERRKQPVDKAGASCVGALSGAGCFCSGALSLPKAATSGLGASCFGTDGVFC